jgi:hypothetical protein
MRYPVTALARCNTAVQAAALKSSAIYMCALTSAVPSAHVPLSTDGVLLQLLVPTLYDSCTMHTPTYPATRLS